jgi:hypothetical protein
MSERPRRPIGQPVEDVLPEGDDDSAGEHDDTSVEGKVTSGRDDGREPGSPRGWSGLETGGVAD